MLVYKNCSFYFQVKFVILLCSVAIASAVIDWCEVEDAVCDGKSHVACNHSGVRDNFVCRNNCLIMLFCYVRNFLQHVLDQFKFQ